MRKYFKLSLFAVMAVALVATCAIGCGGGTKEVKEPYKIGAIFSLTGSQSNLGIPEENTVNMLVDKINKAGGVNGHNVSVTILDDASDATQTATAANQLINDQVLAIIGPTFTGATLAIMNISTEAQIPLVSCAAGTAIINPVQHWIFKTPQTTQMVVMEILQYLQSQNISKVATITSTSAFGAEGKSDIVADAANYNITIVDNLTYAPADTSMISQLTVIKGTDAQAVVCWDTDQGSAIVARNMQTLNMSIPLYCSHGIATPAFIQEAGDAANGVIFAAGKLPTVDTLSASDPQYNILKTYRDDYDALYNASTLSTFGGHAYDALYIVTDALQGIPEGLNLSASRAALRDGIEETTNFIGISGIFTMSPTDHLGMQPGSLVMIKVVNGSFTPLQ